MCFIKSLTAKVFLTFCLFKFSCFVVYKILFSFMLFITCCLLMRKIWRFFGCTRTHTIRMKQSSFETEKFWNRNVKLWSLVDDDFKNDDGDYKPQEQWQDQCPLSSRNLLSLLWTGLACHHTLGKSCTFYFVNGGKSLSLCKSLHPVA